MFSKRSMIILLEMCIATCSQQNRQYYKNLGFFVTSKKAHKTHKPSVQKRIHVVLQSALSRRFVRHKSPPFPRLNTTSTLQCQILGNLEGLEGDLSVGKNECMFGTTFASLNNARRLPSFFYIYSRVSIDL